MNQVHPRQMPLLAKKFTFAADKLFALLTWMSERERARIAREAGAAPPVDLDPVIRDWRFCNVDRRDDRVTRFIHNFYVKQHGDNQHLWFNLVIARLINWPATLEQLGYCYSWDREHFLAVIQDRTTRREKVYTGAYMIPGGPAGLAKHEYLARSCFDALWAKSGSAPLLGESLAEWSKFLTVPLLGNFLRNQVLTDLRDAPGFAAVKDWSTFVLGGPGTIRGLNRLLGYPLTHSWKQTELGIAILELREALLVLSPQWAAVLRDPNNLTNCLCEFDKWMRVRNGEGKPRARYSPDPQPLLQRPSNG